MSQDLKATYENKTPEVVSYKCPNCGGPLTHDIETQKWGCKYCKSFFTPEELPKLIDQHDTDNASSAQQEEAGLETQEYTCPGCGGRIIADKNTVATYCIYCQNPTVIAGRLVNDQRPNLIVPFTITKESVLEILMKSWGKRPFTPGIFIKRIRSGEIHGLYVPYWLYDTKLDSQITGRGENITTWSDSNYNYTKTDVYHVERSGVVMYKHVPSTGSKRLADKEMQNIEPFNYEEMKDFNISYLSGHFAESYDVNSDDAFKNAYFRMTVASERALASDANYSNFTTKSRNHKYSNRVTRYAMMPVWIFSAKYNGKLYRFLINGQSGKITGKLPISVSKVLLWLVGIFCGSLLIVAGIFLSMGI